MKGDKDKHYIRVATWWLRHKYKAANKDSIHYDMENCGNIVIKKIYDKIIKDSNKNMTGYHKATITELTELFLWIIERDTAYRDPFFYFLKEILDDKDTLYPLVLKYVKNPKDWYVNRWNRSKESSKKLKDEGRILEGGMAMDETYFVPSVQKRRFRELTREMDAESRKKSRRKNAW